MAVECASEMDAAPTDRFEYFWNIQGEWVEEPNQRRGGESGVQRILSTSGRLLYAKRQTGHIYRSWRHPLGRPTALREQDAIMGLRLLDVEVPELVFCGSRRDSQSHWQALLVTAALDGFVEIDAWYAAGERERQGEALHDRVLQALAGTLARMHKGRWQHGCLYAKHVFVRVDGEGDTAQVRIALLDFEKCRQRLSSQRAAAHDLKQLRRHSSWSETDWRKLYYFYTTVFGSPIKGL
ncbi:lipopolysaccharide kinase InaA family protein [Pseudomonas sp. LD120]|uniref:lipopolysaccharide kinase InaA family protein n=1 Tax=Pseudomonas sp. LD120 TaxID=485751 RepID=UPI00135A2914|nr:lipopolysaccharide kinase InaA family protein [Pseudomonas sp. LD120]KAF0865078.1 InaA protein [Pseudomonas sp. LD120]